MILELSQTLIGHIIGHRILLNATSSSKISDKSVDAGVVFSCCLNLILISLVSSPWFLNLFYMFVCSVLVFLTPQIILLARKALWSKAEESFLAELYLKMRAGTFMTKAIREVCSKHSNWIRDQFEKEIRIWERGEKSLNHQIFGSIFQEIGEVYRHNSRPSERILSILRQKRLLNKFRRKSSASVSQIRAQAAVISLMYWAVFLWRAIFAEQKVGAALLLVSFLLYLAGCLVLIYIGRSFKWKM
ncbi:MAG: hypothetical protein LW875_02545 [Proteobacteria bacterium]|jgi:hypothetical protein|nr:hypothetical protein [Pseudomonadota bacterium]